MAAAGCRGAISAACRLWSGGSDRRVLGRRVLGTVGFAAIATQLVAGGPFGLESSVQAAGPLPVFACFALLPILFSLPQALVTAELSCLLDDNGGYVVWVTHAFGDFAAWMTAMNGVAGNCIDLTLYPVLVAQFVSSIVPGGLSTVAESAVRAGVIAAGLAINCRGIGDVGTASGLLLCLVMVPFAISFVVQLPAVLAGLPHVAQVAPSIPWSAFLSSMLWSYCGWSNLGALAGEVKDPQRTYPRGTAATIVCVTLVYGLPTLVSIATHPNYRTWVSGSLSSFTADVSPALAALSLAASVLCQVGVFTAGLATSARMVWALAGGGRHERGGNVRDVAAVTRHLPAALAGEWAPTGAPVPALAAHCGCVLLLGALPFNALVQADMFFACVTLLAVAAAFLRLRAVVPLSVRPAGTTFTVPRGQCGAIATVVPLVAIAALAMALAPLRVWAVAAVVNAAAAAVFAIRVACDQRARGRGSRGNSADGGASGSGEVFTAGLASDDFWWGMVPAAAPKAEVQRRGVDRHGDDPPQRDQQPPFDSAASLRRNSECESGPPARPGGAATGTAGSRDALPCYRESVDGFVDCDSPEAEEEDDEHGLLQSRR